MNSKQILDQKKTKGLKSFEYEYQQFVQNFPDYLSTKSIDQLREADYSILDRQGHVYLDFTGSGLYGESQILTHTDLLRNQVFGNPHSTNPTSANMNHLVESTRKTILNFFHANEEEYVCIFTQNASGALKLIGESYPFTERSKFLLTYDNHNSVNGIREFARKRSTSIVYIPMTTPEMRINEFDLKNQLSQLDSSVNNLFAYPAQSNFSGVQHSLEWIKSAQDQGWDVLLDAAAFLPTNSLDLSVFHPDFIVLSFYKLFGYPTGVGALIAKRSQLARLSRPWFAGGTITVASVQGDRYYLHTGPEGFEDGTLNFLNLPAIEIGLKQIQRIGYPTIHLRIETLTQWLLTKLIELKHENGNKLIQVYGPSEMVMRGGTISMNFFDLNGHFIDHGIIEEYANRKNISIRTGCFCNPGDGEVALGISKNDLNACFSMKPRLEYKDLRSCIDGKSTGAVRISIGFVSNFSDVFKFVELASQFVNKSLSEQ